MRSIAGPFAASFPCTLTCAETCSHLTSLPGFAASWSSISQTGTWTCSLPDVVVHPFDFQCCALPVAPSCRYCESVRIANFGTENPVGLPVLPRGPHRCLFACDALVRSRRNALLALVHLLLRIHRSHLPCACLCGSIFLRTRLFIQFCTLSIPILQSSLVHLAALPGLPASGASGVVLLPFASCVCWRSELVRNTLYVFATTRLTPCLCVHPLVVAVLPCPEVAPVIA